jgi:hypothetical protein
MDKDVQDTLLKCKLCDNYKKIISLEHRVDHHDNRFSEGDARFMRIESELKENSRVTNEIAESVKNINEMLYIDRPDQKSLQSTLMVMNTRLGYVWSFMIFIIVSLAGITFFLIQKAVEPQTVKTDHQIILPYTREKIHYVDDFKPEDQE